MRSALTLSLSLSPQVKAVDDDEGENGRVTYNLASPSAYFVLDASTGQLRTKASLASLAGTVQRLEIVARDHGSPQYTATGMLEK